MSPAMGIDPRLRPVLELEAARSRPELPPTAARARASEFQARIRDTYYRPGPEPAAIEDVQVPVGDGQIGPVAIGPPATLRSQRTCTCTGEPSGSAVSRGRTSRAGNSALPPVPSSCPSATGWRPNTLPGTGGGLLRRPVLGVGERLAYRR